MAPFRVAVQEFGEVSAIEYLNKHELLLASDRLEVPSLWGAEKHRSGKHDLAAVLTVSLQ